VIKTPADYAAALKDIQAKLDKITTDVPKATVKAVADVAIDCIGRAVERAPVELGDLRGSGYATVNQQQVARGNADGSITSGGAPAPSGDGTVEAEIGFTAPYALVQHEHVEFEHPLGGEAKYLESVIVERSAAWKKHLADSAGGALGGDV
jgi:hypothetical protein